MIQNQVDCVVRFHDSSRIAELSRCLFSLVGQEYRPLRIVVVTQRFSAQELAKVRAAVAPLFLLPDAPELVFANWVGDQPRDARTELLNLGLSTATGQYIGFLDYDDTLYPEAFTVLVDRLRLTGAAITFAAVRVMQLDVFRQFSYMTEQLQAAFAGEGLLDLFQANFCPIHSYLIERTSLTTGSIKFDTSMTWEEDYDLLLMVCAAHTSDFEARKTVIGDYLFKNDGSNSVPADGIVGAERTLEYERVRAMIEVRRRTTLVSTEVQRQLGIRNPSPSITIRGALSELGRYGL